MKTYRLLSQAMEKRGMVGIGTFVMRRKSYLAALRLLSSGYLALETMYFQEELVQPNELPELTDESVSKRELSLAEQLIDSFAGTFDPTNYSDAYQEELRSYLEKKGEGETVTLEQPAERSGKVIDLMDALKKSVQKRKGSKKSSTKKRSTRKRKSS